MMVVKLAVEYDPDGLVFVCQRLITERRKIDDRKARVDQSGMVEGPRARPVGTAVPQGGDNPRDNIVVAPHMADPPSQSAQSELHPFVPAAAGDRDKGYRR